MNKLKINDLPSKERKVVIGILRGLLVRNGLARQEGLERTEELSIKLLDKGHLIIHFDGENFWLKGTQQGREFLKRKGIK